MSPHSFFLNIGGIKICLLSDDRELKLEIEGATKKFLVPQAHPDVTILAKWGELSAESGGKKIFDSGGLWQLYLENNLLNPPHPPLAKGGKGGFSWFVGGEAAMSNYVQDCCYRFHFTTRALGPVPYKIASFNRDFTAGEVCLHRPYFDAAQIIYPLEYPLDELLLINLLALGKGVEIHACGVIDPSGNGHLFVGRSGAGKTTVARLWQNVPGVTVLSDDRIILRKAGETICMYGTPWHGEAQLASPDRAPLTRVYFLTKEIKNELVSLRKSDAAGRLFACSFPPFYSQQGLDFIMGFIGEVVKAVPSFELRFLPDERVLELIQKGDR